MIVLKKKKTYWDKMSMSHFFSPSTSKLQKPITLPDFTAACGRSYVEKKNMKVHVLLDF